MLGASNKKKNRAQVIGEYALTIALVIVVLVSMTFFLRRLFMARIKDSRDAMLRIVRSSYNGTIPTEYEPYYAQTNAEVTRNINDQTNLVAGGRTGVFRKTYNEAISVNSQSVQLPPKDAR